MRRLQIRLWMLLLLVALFAVSLGGYRWWRARQEVLRMAAWHEWRAGVMEEALEFLRQADGLSDDLRNNAREGKQLSLPRDEVARVCEELGIPAPTRVVRPLVAREEEVRAQLEHWSTWRNPFARACSEAQRWHAERAKHLRTQRVVVVAREKERDRLHYESVRQCALPFGDAYTAGINSARQRREQAEKPMLGQLKRLRTALASGARSREARNLQLDLFTVANLQDALARQQDLHVTLQSQAQTVLSAAAPDYRLPTPPPAASPPPPPAQTASTRP